MRLSAEAVRRTFQVVGSQVRVATHHCRGRVTDDLHGGGKRGVDFAVVDEAQDVGIAELRFLAAIGSSRPDGLFLTSDLGQRIFQQPFS